MRGTTSAYAIDPVGECVIGMVVDGGMEVRRRRQRHLFRAGDLCAWDPSSPHAGWPHGGRRWEARLVMIDLPALEDLTVDPDEAPRRLQLGPPLIRDARLAAGFLRLHRALEGAGSALERQGRLLEWLQAFHRARGSVAGGEVAPRQDAGLRRARELLMDDPCANVSLAQLARAAGMSRHRLSRLFRKAFGLAPHRLQLARRLRLARTMLEAGTPLAEVAQRAGFADQSHLHRHLRRTTGLTPARYASLVRSNVQDGSRPLE
jgi:AraC-like DNA-binding protein